MHFSNPLSVAGIATLLGMATLASAESLADQANAPWGLARFASVNRLPNQPPTVNNFTYHYSSPTPGRGVDIYIVSTGVRLTHNDIRGRGTQGPVFGGYPPVDENGLGTHCAALAAGRLAGIAKDANIISVKVLSGTGAGRLADFISGINYVANTARSTGRPSVAVITVAVQPSPPLDDAVERLVASGVHVVVPAGDGNIDTNNVSPARAKSPITVGGTTIQDAKAGFSNYGASIDILAPGDQIFSAWNTADTASKIISTTFSSACYVGGLIADTLSRRGNASPPTISNFLKQSALVNKIQGVPAGTLNLLAHQV